ncbi:glycosyltransferase family 2 protein [Chloroflexota bacterium]|nr:glycosyltransferase family 2 protein [Chloroflexota bacterium]
MTEKLTRDSFWAVIPTFNRADDLIATLDSLAKSEVNMEQVIVVDNGSKDDTVEKMKANYPKVHLLALENNIGATGGSNAGFNYALAHGAEYVIRMDSDIEVDPNFLAPLIEVANSDPSIGIISPKIYFYNPHDVIWYGGVDSKGRFFKITDGFRGQTDSPENSHIRQVDYTWGATMLISRVVLEKTGGFDTDFFVYYEEFDFCDRAQALGYKIMYVPEAKIWHKVGSISYTAFTAYNWNKSKMIFIRKHAPNIFSKLYFILYAFAYAFADAAIHALKLRERMGNRGPFKDTLRGLWNGLTISLTEPREKK